MICDARLKNKDNIIDVEDYKFLSEFQKNNGYNIHLFPIAINKYGRSKKMAVLEPRQNTAFLFLEILDNFSFSSCSE